MVKKWAKYTCVHFRVWAYFVSLEPVTSNVVSGQVTFQDFSLCGRLFKDSLISEKK